MQLGLGFGLGVCPSSLLKQKKKKAKKRARTNQNFFLSKQPHIALAWNWRSREALQRKRGQSCPVQRELPALPEAGAGGCSWPQPVGRVGEHGAGCQGRGAGAGAKRCPAAQGVAAQDPLPPCRPGRCGLHGAAGRGEAMGPSGGGGGGELQRWAQLWPGHPHCPPRVEGTTCCCAGPGRHKAASTARRGQLLAGCTSSGSSNLL